MTSTPVGQRRQPRRATSCSRSTAPTARASCTPSPASCVEHGGNIIESQQFGDRANGRFFMRIDFAVADGAVDVDGAARRLRARSPSGSR